MKYLKLFEKDEDAIYNRTSDTLYDAPGVAYIKDVDKVIYAPFELNQKYYIDENYNAVLYRDAYIDIVNNSETINVTDISSPIVKTIDFTFENITTNNIEIVLSGTSNVTSSEIILDGNSGSFDITYTPVNYGTESVQVYLKSYNIENPEELVSSNIVSFNYVVEEELDYLTFNILEDGDITVTNKTNGEGIRLDLQYKLNDNDWENIQLETTEDDNYAQTLNLNQGDVIKFRGDNILTDGDYYDDNSEYLNRNNIYFSGSAKFNVGGKISSLLSKDCNSNNVKRKSFEYLFGECHNIVDASELILTSEVREKTYSGMMAGCFDLVYGPKVLPANNLYNGCYAGMFFGCTSLAEAPELPATTLAEYCYHYMFSGCTSLAEAPELPATTLADDCYAGMFFGCTSLAEAPELPATTLANSCYYGMFSGCTSLETPPELPATTLADGCYRGMFIGCTSLTQAPELPATTLTNTCYSSMFSGCTNLTTAPVLQSTELADDCYRSMFSGCTSLETAPDLPATSLANYCYSYMFYGCTSLTEAPELPAEILVPDCYERMFSDCTSLNYIKVEFTEWNDNSTYKWVYNVDTEGIFECPEGLTIQRGTSYIPSGWIVSDNVSISILDKETLETPITVEANTTQSFTINVDLQQLTLEKCSVTSSNSKFTIGTKKNNSIVVNFKSTTSGTFTSTITVSDNTYNTGKSDSVVLTVNVLGPEKSYYLRYSYSSNDDYNSWTNQIEGTELSNGDISFGPVPCIQHGNYVALTTKANDTSLSGNINISSFTSSHDGSLYNLTLQEKNGKYEYRVETKNAGDYTIIFNLTNKTIYVEVYSSDEPVNPDEPTDPDEPVDPDEPTDPTEDTQLKVASYNIRYYNGAGDSGNTDFRAWPSRKVKVFEMIRKHDMDVCGLQEVTQLMSQDIINELTEYTYVGYGRDNGLENSESTSTGEQTGLIYKKDKFNELGRGRFFLSNTPNSVSRVPNSMFNRLATWVKLQDKETLKEFIFASTHFDHPTDSSVADSVREQQAQYAVSNILSIAGNLPIFFVGDFNSESNTTAYSVLTSTFNDSYNFLTVPEGGYVCNLDQINSGKCPGCSEIGNTYTGLYSSSDIDPKRIDFVLYLPNKSSISSYLVDTDNLGLEYYPSDHLPVVCDMVI